MRKLNYTMYAILLFKYIFEKEVKNNNIYLIICFSSEMNLSEASILFLLNERNQNKDKIIAMNLNSLNIQSLSLFNLWTKVEYLSLKYNLIKDLSFLPYFPMLFYLDISNNSIEDFDLFNTYNSYGYLSLTSPSNFLEK